MLPKYLKIRNIGPFISEDIDFTKLDRLFLITGDTGSGKTFIFDCITYALYGKISGIRGELNNAKVMISKYRDENEDSFVEFTFGIGNIDYKIVRYLEKFSKPKTAIIRMEKSQDGKNFEVIAEKAGEVSAEIQKVLKYGIDDFSQVVLLPQGQFEKFIESSSSEKADILKKIFPVQKFSAITEIISSKTKELKSTIDTLDEANQNISEGKSLDDLKTEKAEFDKKAAETKELQSGGNTKIQKLTGDIASLEGRIENATKKEKAEKELLSEENRKQEIDALSVTVENGKKAQTAGEFYRNKTKALEDLEKKTSNLTLAKDRMEKALGTMEKALEEEKKIPELNENIKKISGKIQEEKGLAEKALEYEKTTADYGMAEKNFNTYSAQVNTVKEKLLEYLNTAPQGISLNDYESSLIQEKADISDKKKILEDQLSNVQKRNGFIKQKLDYENQKTELEKKFSEIEKSILDTKNQIDENKTREKIQGLMAQAASLAKELKENMPCPVCGSLSHPSPAHSTDSTDYRKIIENLEGILDQQTKEKNNISSNLAKVLGQLKVLTEEIDKITVEKPEDELVAEISTFTEKLNETSTLIKTVKDAQENSQKCEDELKEKEEKLLEAQKQLALIEGIILTYKKELGESPADYKTLTQNVKALETELSQTEDQLKSVTKLVETAKKECSAAEENLDNSQNLLETAKTSAETAVSEFTAKLLELGIENEEQYLSMEIDEKTLESYEKTIRDHLDKILACKNTISTVNEDGKVPELTEKREALILEKTETEEKLKLCDRELEEITLKIGKLESTIKAMGDNDRKLKKLIEEHQVYKYLNDKFNYKTTLESWALASYYTTIVKLASQRLHDFSNGRFTLQQNMDLSSGRANSDTSLDLFVTDAHNGETREIKTLSGGERFEAALSLALAITDSVPYDLDSIFIDEGFGTLDVETRRKVMPILRNLQENKTVGIISHVEAFQTEIKSQIQLTKTESGSHIKVI